MRTMPTLLYFSSHAFFGRTSCFFPSQKNDKKSSNFNQQEKPNPDPQTNPLLWEYHRQKIHGKNEPQFMIP